MTVQTTDTFALSRAGSAYRAPLSELVTTTLAALDFATAADVTSGSSTTKVVSPAALTGVVADIAQNASDIASNVASLTALMAALGDDYLTGTAAPTAAQGEDGDNFLNTVSGDVYEKTGGAWSLVFSFASLLGVTGGVSRGTGSAVYAGINGTSMAFRSVAAAAAGGVSVNASGDDIVLALDIDSLPVAP